jgi:hypothetical protein
VVAFTTPSAVVVSTPVVSRTETVAVSTPSGTESGTVEVAVSEATVIAPVGEEEVVIRVTVETETLHVAAVHTAATAAQAVTGLPIAGLVFQFANTPVVNAQGLAVPHLADQLFQNLVRTSNTLDSSLLGTVREVYDRILAGQLLMPPATADNLDRLDWNDMGSDLDVPVAGLQEDLTTRNSRRQTPVTQTVTPSAVQTTTVDQSALDQVFAQADEGDVIMDDE